MAVGVLEIEVGALRAVLADVTGVVEARNTIPVLSNVLLTVTPTSLTVMGTDLDVWVSRHATVETGRGFQVTVEATTFRRVVDKLPTDARCILSLEDATLSIVAGRGERLLVRLRARGDGKGGAVGRLHLRCLPLLRDGRPNPVPH